MENNLIKCVYPGSFDPVTSGHLDIIERASALFEDITVAVLVNRSKKPAFTTEQRIDFIKRSTGHIKGIKVDSFSGLLVDYTKKLNANLIIRGLRALSDFEYEFQLASLNARLSDEIETIFLMTDTKNSYLSSSMVKELASHGGDLTGLVPEVIKNDIIELCGRTKK
jgi:pantetheine-phosphate adenylyltransferase